MRLAVAQHSASWRETLCAIAAITGVSLVRIHRTARETFLCNRLSGSKLVIGVTNSLRVRSISSTGNLARISASGIFSMALPPVVICWVTNLYHSWQSFVFILVGNHRLILFNLHLEKI